MTPDFGLSETPASTAEPPAQPPRNASLPPLKLPATRPAPPASQGTAQPPSYTVAPSIQGGRSAAAKRPQPAPIPRSAQGGERPLQMHPHSTAVPVAAASVAQGKRGGTEGGAKAAAIASPRANPPAVPNPTTNKVTPLRPSPRRQRSAPSERPVPSGAATPSDVPLRQRQRPATPRRRMVKPPLPVLYLIRLIILGVGVAAIAGTLLSVLSPANVASSGRDTAAAPRATPTRAAAGGLITGGRATAVVDLGLNSEMTRLKAQLEQLATLTPGLTPVAFGLDLDTGRYVNLGGESAIAAASTIKVPILIAFLQEVDAGTMALNQSLIMEEHHVAGGSGTMRNDAMGTEYTALDVATRMIVTSDNTATNIMIDALGGQDALNQLFAVWGLESTVLRNPLPDLEGTNTTSARDLALIMALIDQGGLLTMRSRDRLISIMQRTVNRSLIPFGINDGSLMANKTGDIGALLGDVALVDVPNGKRYTLAVLVQRPNNDGRASELIRRMTETIHGEMKQPIAPVGNPSARPSPEAEGPGELESSDVWETEPVPGVRAIPQERVPSRDDIPQG
jgi:beta-lactamase class A